MRRDRRLLAKIGQVFEDDCGKRGKGGMVFGRRKEVDVADEIRWIALDLLYWQLYCIPWDFHGGHLGHVWTLLLYSFRCHPPCNPLHWHCLRHYFLHSMMHFHLDGFDDRHRPHDFHRSYNCLRRRHPKDCPPAHRHFHSRGTCSFFCSFVAKEEKGSVACSVLCLSLVAEDSCSSSASHCKEWQTFM